MLQSLSISKDSAYGKRGYTLPILVKLGSRQLPLEDKLGTKDLLNGQSSPGTLHVGQHPSKGTRQIPQTSSSGSPFSSVLPVSHCHWAMACHCLTMTFMVVRRRVCLYLCTRHDCGVVGPEIHSSHVIVPANNSLPAYSRELLTAMSGKETKNPAFFRENIVGMSRKRVAG
jgi:hypothetical protein